MSSAAQTVGPPAHGWSALVTHWRIIAQLALVVLVVELYLIEGPLFLRVLLLTAGGFLVSVALPLRHRLPFFVLLSFAGVFAVFGLVDGAWLLAAGLMLIGISHLGVSIRLRALLLVLTAGALALMRTGVVGSPWSPVVWPVLGSMFMFRLIVYMRAMSVAGFDRSPWGALAYFFMLPNVAFPLYPVVDYQTFRRTHFDRLDTDIYEQGLVWIARGVVHLVLYRFVYHRVLNDPLDVVRLGDLVQLMLGTFLLYLKVSGQFHLIVGLLHLFGFRLPETHKLYYLARSFTDLWRRINIYWTEFMTNVVFYPVYFNVKRLGPATGVAVATGAVFVTTWLLHSYQWFWLRGGFPLTLPDTLFWGILGALVVLGALRELKSGKPQKRSARPWDLALGLRAARTFTVFCILWSLWSAESVGQWVWMLSAASVVDAKGVLLVLGVLLTVTALGGRNWDAQAPTDSRWRQFARRPSTRTVFPLLGLLAIAQPAVQRALPAPLALALSSLQSTGLNVRDASRKHRGYYEQLEVRGQLNAATQGEPGEPGAWVDPAGAGIIRYRKDWIERDLVPSRHVIWNGRSFRTNSHGMRDHEYPVAKPAGTFRIALLGPSHVMGNGVADGETFEQLVEDRLNADAAGANGRRFEILNFGVDGYSLPQQLALLEDRVFQFEPDVVIFTQYHRTRVMTAGYLAKLIAKEIPIADDELRTMLGRAGIPQTNLGRVPVPLESGRAVAAWIGLDPRMPQGELDSRTRRIADSVNDWAIGRIADVVRSHGARPVVLALNVVIDDSPDVVPNLDAMRRAGVVVLDLFDVFPASSRASLRVTEWDDHPNAAGHLLIARALFDKLGPVIEAVPDTAR